MNTFEIMLLAAGIAVSGAGIVALFRAARTLKSLNSKSPNPQITK